MIGQRRFGRCQRFIAYGERPQLAHPSRSAIDRNPVFSFVVPVDGGIPPEAEAPISIVIPRGLWALIGGLACLFSWRWRDDNVAPVHTNCFSLSKAHDCH